MRFLCILNKLSMGNFFMSCKIEIFIKFENNIFIEGYFFGFIFSNKIVIC